MKIIISPAKKMKMIDDINIECTTPLFLSKTTELLNHIQSLEYSELKSYLKCSDTIAQTTYDQFQNMSLNKNTTPAILSYSGIQYQYMAPMYLQMIKSNIFKNIFTFFLDFMAF